MFTRTRNLTKQLLIALVGGTAVTLTIGMVSQVQADEKKLRTLAEQLIHDVHEGKVKANSEDAGAVQELIVKRNIPITYQTVNTLMHTPNAFGPGAACATCHSGQDPVKSYRGLDLSTCKGMLEGSTEEPKRTIFKAGTDPKRDILIRRLRNNRMPLGAGFHLPSDRPNYVTVKNWI